MEMLGGLVGNEYYGGFSERTTDFVLGLAVTCTRQGSGR